MIAVDLDCTLARYESGMAQRGEIGAPIEPMVMRVKTWLNAGLQVVIFTARVSIDPDGKIAEQIGDWTEEHIGVRLHATCEKTFGMQEYWDDRAITVEKNTGKRLTLDDEGDLQYDRLLSLATNFANCLINLPELDCEHFQTPIKIGKIHVSPIWMRENLRRQKEAATDFLASLPEPECTVGGHLE